MEIVVKWDTVGILGLLLKSREVAVVHYVIMEFVVKWDTIIILGLASY